MQLKTSAFVLLKDHNSALFLRGEIASFSPLLALT
jgi:hypothetical protein